MLSKKAIKLLGRVKAAILADPKRVDMDHLCGGYPMTGLPRGTGAESDRAK